MVLVGFHLGMRLRGQLLGLEYVNDINFVTMSVAPVKWRKHDMTAKS